MTNRYESKSSALLADIKQQITKVVNINYQLTKKGLTQKLDPRFSVTNPEYTIKQFYKEVKNHFDQITSQYPNHHERLKEQYLYALQIGNTLEQYVKVLRNKLEQNLGDKS